MSVLGNVFGSPRTTLAGVYGILLAALGSSIIPQLAAYLGAQPSIGWQLLGVALGSLGPALLRDAPKVGPAPAARGHIDLVALGAVAVLALAALAGCTTLTALNGTTGPIPVAVAPAAGGGSTATATVTVSASPVIGTAPNCGKPVSVSFDTLAGYHDACSATIPVAATNGICR